MKEYFVLAKADRADLQSVVRDETGDFDIASLRKCVLDIALPSYVKLYVDECPGTDILANPLSWLIVSDKLLSILHNLSSGDFQFIKAPVYSDVDGSFIDGYYIINIITCLNVLPGPLASIQAMSINTRGIPDAVHIFRIKGEESVVIVSSSFLDAVSNIGILGVALIKIENIR